MAAAPNDNEPLDDGEPVVIPYRELSEDALRGVLESFVLREGTEYGERDFSLEQKVAHVLEQLRRGEAQIVFDPQSETIDIVVAARRVRSY
ncbi:MAG TPA: YheU family protein [Steroidobacteraceae bacterium]|nr:YheU family protein [Steroidobacteraceae bacterium]